VSIAALYRSWLLPLEEEEKAAEEQEKKAASLLLLHALATQLALLLRRVAG
jgi:hypothetical protein